MPGDAGNGTGQLPSQLAVVTSDLGAWAKNFLVDIVNPGRDPVYHLIFYLLIAALFLSLYFYLFSTPPSDKALCNIETFCNLVNNNNDDSDSSDDANNSTNEHAADLSSMDAHMGSVDLNTADGPAMDVDLQATGPRAAANNYLKLPFPTNLTDGSLGVEYHPMYVHSCLSV
ncbi:hypothetical protein HYPSUDRAFT_208540 [Hypholoma sublateritium FD-334 SS-4]|uniref:Uncharacterized protein n=1 Tax=Hypholoma sublateritium (strain FD-334 SS-4) TaxID=945553 RepID=A0A0D2N644_HYPSF|nr:hypothetical protein HYPSUDRAFT_208540 [Hypholoma sublateritium FD-334 SS-4]